MARKVACLHKQCSGYLELEHDEIYAVLVCDKCDHIVRMLIEETLLAREQRSGSPLLAIAGGRVASIRPPV